MKGSIMAFSKEVHFLRMIPGIRMDEQKVLEGSIQLRGIESEEKNIAEVTFCQGMSHAHTLRPPCE